MSRQAVRRAVRRAGLVLGGLATIVVLAAGFWIPVKAGLAQFLLERAWHRAQAGDEQARPWPWADTTPVASLHIPAIDAAWVVLGGATGRNLAFAPTRMDGSAALGEPGVTVIAGHRDTHFEVLEDLPLGTEIVLEDTAGKLYRFQVSDAQVVHEARAKLRIDADRNVLVLVTCYPFDALTAGGPLRYVIQAEPLARSAG